jgi:geranylgeranyl reductase family protein
VTAAPDSVEAPARDVDVVVVGGGPAGASAAATAARRGLDVVVVDKATFPRDKCCGDGLTVWALRQLEDLGLDPDEVPSWRTVHRTVVRSPSGHELTVPLPDRGIFAAVARRDELDAAVLELAARAGAVVLDGHECVDARTDEARITIRTDAGPPIRARFAVGADGMWSPLRKHVGGATAAPAGYRGEWHAFRQYFEGVTGPAADELFVWFEPDFLPGYAWSFPVGDGTANVGFGILRDGRWRVGAMGQLWAEVIERPHIRHALGPGAEPDAAPRAWPIPCRIGALPLAHDRVLFVGDAAAAADHLTGEGIGQALATGRWAAAAIAGHLDDPASAAAAYERRVDEELAADHRMSVLLGRALRHRKGARAAVRIAGLSPWTRRNFGRWLFEDYPRAMAFTPRRWHRGAFTAPGAYAAGTAASR